MKGRPRFRCRAPGVALDAPMPQKKMGAGVATSPHFSWAAARAREGAGAPWERFRPEPFGPGRSLGSRAAPCGAFRFPDRLQARPRGPAELPIRAHPRNIAVPRGPFAVPSPEGGGSAGPPEESGFGFRLALLPRHARSSALPRDRPCGRPPLPRWSLPQVPLRFRSGRSSAASVDGAPAFRVAPTRILGESPVDYGDIGGKKQSLRRRLLPQGTGGSSRSAACAAETAGCQLATACR